MKDTEHQPVLLTEVLEALAIEPEGTYIDATFGRGGHSRAILARLGPYGRLMAIDRDPEAVASARGLFGSDKRFSVHRGPFSMLEQIASDEGVIGRVRGILADLGVSSPQFGDAGRGFSFQHPGPLDMRMDPDAGESAASWLARVPERELADVIYRYGEERYARRIARVLVQARRTAPITETTVLAELVSRAIPRRERSKHPATRTFQAIRIFINQELDELKAFLEQSISVLCSGGRLCIVSFHSLEDRIVKRFLRDRSRSAQPGYGELPAASVPVFRRPVRPVTPTDEEIARNIRARSAILRSAERI